MMQRDTDGQVRVLIECPRRESYDWHGQARLDDHEHFQCATGHAGSTYLPS